MDTFLIIATIVLIADIASNVFYIFFGNLVVKSWKRRAKTAENKVKLLREVLRQVECEDMPEREW